nr:GIY-YIG nuclease family protein [Oscillochloris trichoides]
MQNGYIYIIKEINEDYYKIGLTKDEPMKRLKQLQTGNVRTLKLVAYFYVKNTRKVESFLHAFLGVYHVRGEWFSIPEYEVSNLIRFIEKSLAQWQGVTL